MVLYGVTGIVGTSTRISNPDLHWVSDIDIGPGDHTGNLSLFPQSTDLYVGPGFTENFMPGYPAKEDSPMVSNYRR